MILIALGGNLNSSAGPPARTLTAALQTLANSATEIVAVSSYYVTPAWPDPADPVYVNAVAHLRTSHDPATLMNLLHETETAFGRIRSARNAPRTLDLDLLAYDGLVQEGPPHLPHPRLAERAFVLVPLAELAPDWVHPVSNRSVQDLLAALPRAGRDAVRSISSA